MGIFRREINNPDFIASMLTVDAGGDVLISTPMSPGRVAILERSLISLAKNQDFSRLQMGNET